MKTKVLVPLLSFLSITSQSFADDLNNCSIGMFNEAAAAYAAENHLVVSDTLLVRVSQGAWTDALGNNSGSAEVAVGFGSRIGYYQVFGKQLGTSDDCTIVRVEKLDPNQVEQQNKEADQLKLAIGEAVYYSEAESLWQTFVSIQPVSADLREEEIRLALNAGDEHIETYSKKEVMNFIDGNIESETGAEFSYQYRLLKNALTKSYTLIRGYKVGEPDSGELKFFIVARSKTGHLVGLYTFSVET